MQIFVSQGGEGNALIFPFPFLVPLIYVHALRLYGNCLRTGWVRWVRSCWSYGAVRLMRQHGARRRLPSFKCSSRESFMPRSGKHEKRDAEHSAGRRNTLQHTEENKNPKVQATEEWERGSWNRYVKREFWHSDFKFTCGSENKGYRWQMGEHRSEKRSLL